MHHLPESTILHGRRRSAACLFVAAFAAALVPTLVARDARAEVVPGGGDVPPITDAPSGLLAVRRGVQGPEGLFHSRILLHINTSRGAVAEPISLAPDFHYGVTDSLQLGLLHNLPMGWSTTPGAGLCLTGTDGGCPRVYNNVGFDAMYGLAFGDVHFSLHSSFFVLRIADPTPLLLTLGLAGKLHFTDSFAIFLDPQIGIAVSDRSHPTAPNRDMLFLPVELQFQLAPPVALKILTGTTGPLDGFGDAYEIPLGLGLVGNVSEAIDLGLRFSFDNLLGQQPTGGSRTQRSSLSLLMHVRI